MTANARHLSLSAEHYTPGDIVERARRVLGAIDLDPASCAEANRTVRAARFFTREDDGLRQPWSGRVFCNPPGGRLDGNRSAQKTWWFRLATEWMVGRIEAAIFVCFSIELLQTTQVETPKFTGHALPIPLDFPICFPSRRVEYVQAVEEVEEPQRALFGEGAPESRERLGDSPPHASAIVYLLPDRSEAEDFEAFVRFSQVFGDLGACVWPRRVDATEDRAQVARQENGTT